MKLPLKRKAILMVVMVGLLIGIVGIVVYSIGIRTLTTREYETRSIDIANAVSVVVDAEQVRALRDSVLAIYDAEDEIVLSDQWGTPEFEEYISHYSAIEESEAFLSLREQLRRVQDIIAVDCLYLTWFDKGAEYFIYLVDGAYEDACPPGCADPLYANSAAERAAMLRDIDSGCAPNITHTEEYGYLMTTEMPIHTEDGALVGFAAVDLSMDEIVRQERQLLFAVIAVFAVMTALASLIGILLVNREIVRPINERSVAAGNYSPSDLKFSEIDVRTGDEIETLANSMKRMERDVKDYVEKLTATQSDLETVKEHAEVLSREANIDALTNLRNKRAYDLALADLEKQGRPYAIVMIDLNSLKTINDRFGHDKGDAAIRNLASLICKVFPHSPVYRIGGDEFVVIMTGEALEEREGQMGRFRDEVRKSSNHTGNQPWERISAACGCAVYNARQDKSAADVFKRADEEMYKNKTKMKTQAE